MISIYNTLSRKKEIFKPIKENQVGIYYCGPTVYWTQHIGNLRGSFSADIVVRTLKYYGYKVNFVRNYTDVGHLTSDEDLGEDKMAKASKRENLDPLKIAQKYIDAYEQDVQFLNFCEPNFKPRATEHVQEMIEMVKVLLDKEYAYLTDLAIYFDTSKFKNYSQLSGQKQEDKKENAGSGDVSDENKKNPTDFALWFFKAGAHKNALQFWPSSFHSSLVKNGDGFPGWHIECSAMSKKYLGESFDIHLGGIEHVPVHHTNEIAQSEAASGKKFVNYWIHNEHLLVNNSKMSKSDGTSFTLRDVIEKGYSPSILRFFFLQAHYRSKLNFTWEAMDAAKNGFERFKKNINNVLTAGDVENISLQARDFQKKFIEKIGDDFNTPQALALAFDVLKSDLTVGEKKKLILDFDRIFGLNLADGQEEKINIPVDILDLLEKRKIARLEKNWEISDEIRGLIEKRGYILEDVNGKQILKTG